MTFGIVMTLSVVTELWEGKGGAYNFDGVLGIMVQGLEVRQPRFSSHLFFFYS